jgi:hypothetical protein
MAIDFKKTQKELYQPATAPSIIDVPEMAFIMIDGVGDPNTSEAYQTAVEVLYGLSYAIKMRKNGGTQPEGYFDFVVPPLEGLWQTGGDLTDKSAFVWTSLIRQPDFVTPEVFDAAKFSLAKKKPNLDCSIARLAKLTEGLCVQIMHLGSFDSEPVTVKNLFRFVEDSGYAVDLSDERRHHEIYLSDPRKTAPEKLKTAIRYPIKPANK